MNFGDPHYLIWLWFIVPVALIYLYGFKKVRKRLTAFALFMPKLMGSLKLSRRRVLLKLAFISLALGFMFVALAKPRWGFEWQMVQMKGSDVIIAVDVSRSMLATDVNPSRIERARREIIDLLDMVKGDRVGIIAFAGGAYVHCPLTSDYGTVKKLLEYLDPRLIRTQGTAIGEALLAASDSLGEASPESSKGRAVILISDGEDESPVSKEVISKLKSNAIRVYTVGVGKTEGAPIPEDGGGFKKDSQGRVVLSKLDEAELKRIASATGGMYSRSVSGDMDLASIYQRGILGKTDETEFDEQKRKIWYERFQWFILVAIILLVAEVFISEYRLVLVLLSFIWFQSYTDTAVADEISTAEESYRENKFLEAKDKFERLEIQNPDELKHAYNKGISSYRLKDYDAARQAFAKSSSSEDKQLSSRSMYNLGNTEAQLKNYDGAISSYEEALKIDPKFKEAQENLGIVKQLKEQKKQDNKDQNKDDKNKDQKNKDDQQKNGQNNDQKNDDQKENQKSENKDQEDKGEKSQDKNKDKSQQDQQDQQQKDQKDKDQSKGQESEQNESKDEPSSGDKAEASPMQQGALNKDQAEKLLREAKDQAAKYMGQKIDKQQRSKKRKSGGKDW